MKGQERFGLLRVQSVSACPLVSLFFDPHLFNDAKALDVMAAVVREAHACPGPPIEQRRSSSMPSGMLQSAYREGAIHPIGAIVFGANVVSITRGVTGRRQQWRSSSKSSSRSEVIGREPSATRGVGEPHRAGSAPSGKQHDQIDLPTALSRLATG